MPDINSDIKFSQRLNEWLKSSGPKTFGDLESIFGEKSFAVAFLLLLATAALPIPTGGITHVFGIIALILAVEMIIGRKTIWVPNFLLKRNLGETAQKKALPKLVGFIKWFERRSKARLSNILNNDWFLRLIGIIIFIFTLGSLLAPPFTGLDTLPALGVVVISLALILDDVVLIFAGLIIGVFGIVLGLALGRAALHLIHIV